MPSVQGRITALLRELEQSEDGGVDAALAVASTSGEIDAAIARVRGELGEACVGVREALQEDDATTCTTLTDDTDQVSKALSDTLAFNKAVAAPCTSCVGNCQHAPCIQGSAPHRHRVQHQSDPSVFAQQLRL
jgi:hypothetical protein